MRETPKHADTESSPAARQRALIALEKAKRLQIKQGRTASIRVNHNLSVCCTPAEKADPAFVQKTIEKYTKLMSYGGTKKN